MVFSNSTPFIALASIDRLDLLHQFLGDSLRLHSAVSGRPSPRGAAPVQQFRFRLHGL